jgi:hypothetical protein
MDGPWVGKAVGVLILLAVVGLFWLSRILEKGGVLRNYSRGLGRGLLEVDAMLRPSKQHVRHVKEEQRKVDDDCGDGADRS